MKVLAVAAVVAALTLPAAAQSALNYLAIYRVVGVTDDGSPDNQGTATVFMCHNLGSTNATVRVRVFSASGRQYGEGTAVIEPRVTQGFSTHLTIAYRSAMILSSGISLQGGHANIVSTTRDVVCTAMIINAGFSVPTGVDLHMLRSNPIPGTVE